MKTIIFKSTPEMFRKEYLGLKCNTVRKEDRAFPSNIRFEILDDFINGSLTGLAIKIDCTNGYESFTRIVSDVTKFEDLYIISWKEESGK